MSTPGDDFPKPLADDSKTVAMALETGGAEWARGELHEAVRWIRRAADAAEAAGDDMRALSLARTAADLKSSLELPATIMPPRDEAAALAPFDDFADQTIVDSPGALAQRAMIAPRKDPAEDDEDEDEGELERPTAPTGPKSAPDDGSTMRARKALRVAVASSARADGTLRVRLLEEGVAPSAAEIEALLVLVDPDAAVPGSRGPI